MILYMGSPTNTPNSNGQSQAKKRKISIQSRSCATSTDESNFEGSCNSKQDLDAGILKSEVYKIYCRNEDPKEAMKQIREMKTCIQFSEPDESVLNEKDLERAFDDTLENLWRFGPAGSSKWTKIRNFLDEKYNADRIFGEPNFKAWTIFFDFQNAGRQDATRETITGDDSLSEYCV